MSTIHSQRNSLSNNFIIKIFYNFFLLKFEFLPIIYTYYNLTSKYLIFQGPAIRGWYNILDRYIKSSGVKGVLLKVSVDQLFFAPTFLIVFLSTMGTLNGESPKQISARVEQDLPEILVSNWKVISEIFSLCIAKSS